MTGITQAEIGDRFVWDEARYARATFTLIQSSDNIAAFHVTDAETGTRWFARQTTWAHEQNCLQLEHEYNMRDRLDPDSAIVPYALIRASDGPALIYPEQPGVDLNELSDGRMPVAEVIRVAIAMVTSIVRLHDRGLIHGDIRPSNFAVESNGQLRVRSFLHARKPGEKHRLAVQGGEPHLALLAAPNSAPYSAPEWATAETAFADERSDLYALGVTLFQVLTGAFPFKAASPSEWIHAHVAVRPLSPISVRRDIPEIFDALILKLLAKDPDDRYQTAQALRLDLVRIDREWSGSQAVSPFELGHGERLLRESATLALVGRDIESQRLFESFSHVTRTSESAVVVLEGPAGSGKTALANDLRRRLLASASYCGTGKADQYQPSTPYAPVVQALRSLCLSAVGRGEHEVSVVGEWLRAALGEQIRLLAPLVPDIQLVDASGPATAEPVDGVPVFRIRQLLIEAFRAFSSAGAPLLLMIDDLQWADEATLGFIDAFLSERPSNVCLIVTCRGDEPGQSPRFVELTQRLRDQSRAAINLAPMTSADVSQMVAQLLNEMPGSVSVLGQMICRKTGGNPFHVQQLLRELIDERLIRFDSERHAWTWDRVAVEAHREAENIVDLLVARMERLPDGVLDMLRWLACTGPETDESLLSTVSGVIPGELHYRLDLARRAGLVKNRSDRWSFVHDRVFEAANALIGDSERPARHAQVAVAMIGLWDAGQQDAIPRIAGQTELAAGAPISEEQAAIFATVLVQAAEQAVAAAALERSLAFLGSAERMLGPDRWSWQFDLARRIAVLRCETLVAVGSLANADVEIDKLIDAMPTVVDKAEAYRLKASLLTVSSNYEGAVAVVIEALRLLDFQLPARPTPEQLIASYREFKVQLAGRAIAELVDLPLLDDPRIDAAMSLLTVFEASMFYDSDGLPLLQLATMACLTLQHGVAGSSAPGLAWLGVMIADLHGEYEDGLELAKVALALVDRHGFERHRTTTLIALDQVSVWTRPLSYALAHARQAKAVGNLSAELRMMCYSCNHIVSDLIAMGEALPAIRDEIEPLLVIARSAGYDDIVDLVTTQSEFVDSLQQGNGQFVGSWQIRDTHDQSALAPMSVLSFSTLVLRGQSAFLFDDLETAAISLGAAESLAWATPAHIVLSDYRLYSVLTAIYASGSGRDPLPVLDGLRHHREQFVQWSALNPGTFENKRMLIDAEFARVRGDDLQAMRLYESSANTAAANGFVHEQALAHELAGRHAMSLSLDGVGRHHVRLAHACYRRWGALGKARRLEARYAFLAVDSMQVARLDSIPGREDPDFMVAMRTAHALSEEIIHERLIQTLVTNMIVHAGAQYGLLLLIHEGRLRIEATGRVIDSDVIVDMSQADPSDAHVPLSVLNTVVHTRKAIVFDDARAQGLPEHAQSLRVRPTRSLLCLPLLKQGALIGVLYLENSLVQGVFTPKRTAMLEMLAPQAANSLEAARLYAELIDENKRRQETEAALRVARTELSRTAHHTVMGELAASIAHEINQPLTSIVSSVGASLRWLRADTPNIEEALANLDDIRTSGIRAADIVRALRALAKQAPAALAPVVIDELVLETLNLTSPEIEVRQVRLHTALGCHGVEVLADRTQIQQVVLNLVTNALDAMQNIAHARELVIASSVEGTNLVVRVRDTGAGIDPEIAAQIFEPFFTTKRSGMGMGLAICKSILEAHGGTLEALPRRHGGMQFVFSLPLARAVSPESSQISP